MAVFSKIARDVSDTLLTHPEEPTSSKGRAAAATSAPSNIFLTTVDQQIERNRAAILICRHVTSAPGNIFLTTVDQQIERNKAAILICRQMVLMAKGLVPWPSVSKQSAMAQELIYLSSVSSETREDLPNTKEDEKKKRTESEKSEKSEKREKSEKAKAKARAKKARLRANQAARAVGKGKGKAIQKEQDWKTKSQIFIDKIFGQKNEDDNDDDPDAPNQYTMAEFLNTISKHGIALPEEAQPNKPNSSETPFPYPNSFVNDFVLAFERSTPGGTKAIPDLQSHLWNHDGELGRIFDLFDLDFSHRQTQRFSPFPQDGIVKRKHFRITDLPPNVLRQIFKHVLVTADVIIPYRYYSDPILRSLLGVTGQFAKPDLNVLVAFSSEKSAIAAVCDEARNVLYIDNKFLFRDPRDFIHFVGAIGWDNLTRLNFDRNILFSRDFFLHVNEDECLWFGTSGEEVASQMLGLRSWSGGWEEVDPADRTPRPLDKEPERPGWDEGEAAELERRRRAIPTPYKRPYPHVTEGAHFSAGNIYHINRRDRYQALGRYNDGDGMGWYHVDYWVEEKFVFRWYEEEMEGKGDGAARIKGKAMERMRRGWRKKDVSDKEREELRIKGRKIRKRMELEAKQKGWVKEEAMAVVMEEEEEEEEEEGEDGKEEEGVEREEERSESPITVIEVEEDGKEEEGSVREEERSESPVTVIEVGKDEEEDADEESSAVSSQGEEEEANASFASHDPHNEAMIASDSDSDSHSDHSSTSTIVEGWSLGIENEILALMEQTQHLYP